VLTRGDRHWPGGAARDDSGVVAGADKPTIAKVIEEFGGDAEALAAEVLALRRTVDELRSIVDGRGPEAPIVIVSPPERPPGAEPSPLPGWYPRPRAESA
jgi:hypothetical protein